MSDDKPNRIVVAECPLSWCDKTAVVADPKTDAEAALKIKAHVNEDHSEDDRKTLIEKDELDIAE
jgi:hypothetical protein